MRAFDRSLPLVLLLLLGVPATAEVPLANSTSSDPALNRSVWITRWDFQSAEDVERAVRWCGALGIDRVFFQVRGQGDAYYDSRLEPRAERLRGKPDFDPLAVALQTGRAANVRVHAWVNVLPAWKGTTRPTDSRHLVHQHPEWFMTDRAGHRDLTSGGGHYTILNPCLPEVRAYIASVVRDIASRYPVDGVHFDYVRFAGRSPGTAADYPYDPYSLRLFRRYSGTSPFDDEEAWDRWRRLSVNTLLFRVAQAVRETRPSAHVSVAVLPDFARARKLFFQDTESWCARGWVDEIVPMSYRKDAASFSRQVRDAVAKSHGVPVSAGIGVYLFDSPEMLRQQIARAERLGASGHSLFAFSNFFPSPSHESKKDARSVRLRRAMRTALLESETTQTMRSANPPPTQRQAAGLASR